MATINSGSIGDMYLQIDYTVTQNTSNNTSTVRATLKLANHYALYMTTLSGSYLSVGGQKVDYSKAISYGGSTTTTTTLYGPRDFVITHKSDGTASCNLTGTFVMNGSYRGYSVGTMTVNQTITLPKIARSSSFTVSSSVNTGSAISGTVTPSSTAFNHKVLLKIGSTTKATITMGVGTTAFSYTIPHNWFPSSTSGVISAVLETYNGTTLVATTSKNVMANVPSNIAPVISWFGVSGVANDLGGRYVQGKTSVTLSTSVSAGDGASVSSYAYSGPGLNVVNTSYYIDTGVLSAPGAFAYTVRVTDSRGRTAQATTQFYVHPYATPNISSVYVQRCDVNGNPSQSGTYAKYTINSSYSNIEGQNTRTVTVAYSSNNGGTYSAETTLQAASDTSNAKTGVYGGGTFALASTYIIRFTIRDAYGATHRVTTPLQSAARPINISLNGKGVAVGAMSTKDGFEVAMPAYFTSHSQMSTLGVDGATHLGDLHVHGTFNHFGVGGLAREVWGDWNTACGEISGLYRGSGLANAPSDNSWYYVLHMAHGPTYQMQIAQDYFNETNLYIRILNNGTWTGWRRIVIDTAHLLEPQGYSRMSNGLSVQWGMTTIPANTSGIDVKFPLTFPNNVRAVTCQNNYSNIRNAACSVSSMSATGFRMAPYVTSSGGVPTVDMFVYWIAIGN